MEETHKYTASDAPLSFEFPNRKNKLGNHRPVLFGPDRLTAPAAYEGMRERDAGYQKGKHGRIPLRLVKAIRDVSDALRYATEQNPGMFIREGGQYRSLLNLDDSGCGLSPQPEVLR